MGGKPRGQNRSGIISGEKGERYSLFYEAISDSKAVLFPELHIEHRKVDRLFVEDAHCTGYATCRTQNLEAVILQRLRDVERDDHRVLDQENSHRADRGAVVTGRTSFDLG